MMVVQRLRIRAAVGKLQVMSVWKCLANSDAKIIRWRIHLDRETGVESMTVDIAESDPLRTAAIAALLIGAPLEISVTLFSLEVLANPEVAHASADSIPIARVRPRLILVRGITCRDVTYPN